MPSLQINAVATLALLLASQTVAAEVYKCVDSDRNIVYRESPCRDGETAATIEASVQSIEAPASLASEDSDPMPAPMREDTAMERATAAFFSSKAEAETARELGIPAAALNSLFEGLRDARVPPPAVEEALLRAVERFRRLTADLEKFGSDAPNALAAADEARRALQTGAFDAAEKHLEAALKTLQRTKRCGAPDSNAVLNLELAGIAEEEDFSSARDYLRRALFAFEKCEDDDLQALKKTAAASLDMGDLRTTRILLLQAAEAQTKLMETRDETDRARTEAAARLAALLGDLAQLQLDHSRAIGHFAEAAWHTRSGNNLAEATILERQGDSLLELGRHDEAQEIFERALRIRERRLGRDDVELAATLDRITRTQRLRGNFDAAEEFAQRTLDLRVKTWGADFPGLDSSLATLARVQQVRGAFGEAKSLLQQALSLQDAVSGAARGDEIRRQLADVYRSEDRGPEAERMLKEILERCDKTYGPAHLKLVPLLDDLSALYRETGRVHEAMQLDRRSLSILESQAGPDHFSLAPRLLVLARHYTTLDQRTDAERTLRRAISIVEKSDGADSPALAEMLYQKALLLPPKRRREEAEALLQRALTLAQREAPPDVLLISAIHNESARLYQELGRYPEAEALLQRQLALTTTALGEHHPSLIPVIEGLADLRMAQHRPHDAEAFYQQAWTLAQNTLGPDDSRTRELQKKYRLLLHRRIQAAN